MGIRRMEPKDRVTEMLILCFADRASWYSSG